MDKVQHQTRGITEEIYRKHISRWKEEALKLGSTEENWDMWMAHQDAHDFHTPVNWHLLQLKQAGFCDVDLIWKYLMWAVIWAKKYKSKKNPEQINMLND